MKIEHVGLPGKDSGVFVPKKRSFYISMLHLYARRTSPERGEFNIYGHLIEGEEHSYGFHVATVTNVPAAVYDATMANMVTLAEARYGNT